MQDNRSGDEKPEAADRKERVEGRFLIMLRSRK